MTIIPPLVHLVSDNEVKGKAKDLFNQIKKSSGKVPKWMRVMANCDDILIGFFTLFKATMDDAPVNKMLKWKIAYRVSEKNKCDFCISVADKMLKTFGIKDEDIAQLNSQLDEKEQVAMEYAEASTEHAYKIDQSIFQKMKKYYTDEQIIEITSVVGLFNFINRFNDSLGVLPDVE